MKNLTLLLAFVSFATLFAQTDSVDSILEETRSVRNDTLLVNSNASGGTLSMEMDKRVMRLVNGKEKESCTRTVVRTRTTETVNAPKSQIDVCKAQPKVRGVKIQIAYTKSRDEANRIRAQFKRAFPGIDTELSYRRPDYRILAGNYFNKGSAGQDLRKISRKFPGALAVAWRVWCRQAR